MAQHITCYWLLAKLPEDDSDWRVECSGVDCVKEQNGSGCL